MVKLGALLMLVLMHLHRETSRVNSRPVSTLPSTSTSAVYSTTTTTTVSSCTTTHSSSVAPSNNHLPSHLNLRPCFGRSEGEQAEQVDQVQWDHQSLKSRGHRTAQQVQAPLSSASDLYTELEGLGQDLLTDTCHTLVGFASKEKVDILLNPILFKDMISF